ncbi:MAG: trypsin-like peptidase domain-containing protein [Deltaproteobacteria bacterium]|nr:trypsin-like peptidase domain-containing protein [Deltaproteobacteria bacterium]
MTASALLVLLVALSAAPSEEIENKTVELASRVKPSVAVLEVLGPGGKVLGNGTGFFVSSDGRMVTNVHVIENAFEIRAVLADGSKRMGKGVLAVDEDQDVALIQIEGSGYPALGFQDGAWPTEGEDILVIGSPLGLGLTVSRGIVSATRRQIPDELRNLKNKKLGPLVQITASTAPGSSGSPVVTYSGQVIGIVQSQFSGTGDLNFAVPVDVARNLVARSPSDATPKPFHPFPLGNAIASGVFLVAVLVLLGWLKLSNRRSARAQREPQIEDDS